MSIEALVMAIRTAAPDSLSLHGWSGTHHTNLTPDSRWRRTSRRLKLMVMLFVVMKPNDWIAFLANSAAAFSHQYITRSALSSTSAW